MNFIESLFIFAAEAPAAEPVPPQNNMGFIETLSMIGFAILLFYVMIFRPEQKRRKAEEAKRSALKKGDRVTTIGGVIGKVAKINGETIVLKMVDGAMIEFIKGSISDVQPASDEESKKMAD